MLEKLEQENSLLGQLKRSICFTFTVFEFEIAYPHSTDIPVVGIHEKAIL